MNANDLTFGIEIETAIPTGAIPVGQYHGSMQAQGLPQGWLAMGDGSIRATAGRQGCEFVSPILKGADGIAQVIAALNAIRAMGGRVNDSTGFHVHVGFNAADVAALGRLIALTANFEKAIYASTGTKRRERNQYCRPISGYATVDSALQHGSRNRYHVLNVENLVSGRKPTVEFRAFAGTLNVDKVIAYVRLCLALVERAYKTSRQTNWTAKTPVATSPMARAGAGATCLTRLFYQIGWTHGRTSYTFGDVTTEGAPTIRESKRTLMALANKYDALP